MHIKNTLWLLSGLLLFFAGDRLAGLWLKNETAHSQFRYSRLYNGSAGAEILLVGNSRGLTFYQPYIEQVSGRSTFNLSYNGMPVDLANVLVQDYLDRYPAPKTMLVDITTCDRPNDELAAAFLTYARNSPRLDTFLHRKMPKAWWGGQLSALFCHNNEVFQRALFYRRRSDADWLIDRLITARLAARVDSMTYGMDPKLIPPLKQMADYARAKGVTVQLVISPYFPRFAANVNKLDALKMIVEQSVGLPVHDYRQALTDPTDFGDLQHPNKKGSMKYIDLLRRDGIIK
jgi:hypothetical protein